MATKVQYLDIAGLTKYDGLIKEYIGEESAKAFKVVRIDGQELQFFKSATPAADASPDATITLPKPDVSDFIEKVKNATSGNFVTLNADGTISDSGKKPSDFIEEHQDISGKADKVSGATSGNFVSLDANGNLEDSGKKPSDFALDVKVGDLSDLATTAKDSVVSAVNEVESEIDSVEQGAKVTLSTAPSATDGYAKTYVISQGDSEIGKIDIPKDMVVSSGSVEVKDEAGAWGEAGTYIHLVIANKEQSDLYIPASSLVDEYTAQKSASQVQLSVSGREISATLVAGAVSTDILADDAVTTDKIAANNITYAKLATSIQDSLDKADTALQEDDVSAISDADIEALFS